MNRAADADSDALVNKIMSRREVESSDVPCRHTAIPFWAIPLLAIATVLSSVLYAAALDERAKCPEDKTVCVFLQNAEETNNWICVGLSDAERTRSSAP